jgi:alanine-synthesizing transaminase
MAGWRVGFIVGNKTLIGAVQKYKSWIDYGMFTPIQVAATIALNGPQECVKEITENYKHRRDVLLESFANAGWEIDKNNATMFCWAKIPEKFRHMGSLEFSKMLLLEGKTAVSPGIGFGEYGDSYVRFALVENELRIKQAVRGIKRAFEKHGLKSIRV